MKTRSCFVLAIVGLASTAAAHNTQEGIPWPQLAAKAGADYQGDGLRITSIADGARLHCLFQRLAGEATRRGLWLTSAMTNGSNDRFHIMAVEVGRAVPCAPTLVADSNDPDIPQGVTRHAIPLPKHGTVTVAGQTVRWSRPGLVEEYSVSLDGVRQDFVVTERPPGEGELRVGLEVTGARVEAMPGGVRLVLEPSGRKLAYSRLRATDANRKELPAQMKILNGRDAFHRVTDRAAMGDAGDRVPTLLAVAVDDAGAVYPVRIDPTFSDANWISMGGFPGADGPVYDAVVDASGNLYVCGEFLTVGGTAITGIAKWNGSKWSALGSGVNSYALAVSGSDVYAGGAFTTVGGIPAMNIAKWNGNAWSALGSGVSDAVTILAVSGCEVYAGGRFTNAGGIAANKIAKWDGSSWSALASGIEGGVGALAVWGSDLYVGGSFTNAGGIAANNIAKWNGSAWSALASGIDGGVGALAVSGSDLYAGGDFTTAGGTAANYIAKWNGSEWSALGTGLSGTPYFSVSALAVLGSDLYAGGWFTTAGGIPAMNIAKWNGSSWSALRSDMSGMNNTVLALAISGCDVYAGGAFTSAGGSVANHIAKWSGSEWSALGSGMNAPVWALAVSGTDLYAGGYFTTAGDVAARYMAKWDGRSWSALGSGIPEGGGFGFVPPVSALAVSGSNLYVGGGFTNAGGIAANHIAKWNGSEWSALGSAMNAPVWALAVSCSNLYAGGEFTNAGGIAANHIAKWDGSSWSALGSGMSGMDNYSAVYALAVSGSNLYAGGRFTTAGGIAATNIAKWNGSEWSALGSGVDGFVQVLAASHSDLYAGGRFTTAGGIEANYIAKWDGSTWWPLGSGISRWTLGWGWDLYLLYALAVSGPDLYVGGNFSMAGGKVSAYVAKAIAVPGDWLRVQQGVPGPNTNTLNYVGVPNSQYLIQFATNLTTSPWLALVTNIVAANGRGTVLDSTATNAQRFYRISDP